MWDEAPAGAQLYCSVPTGLRAPGPEPRREGGHRGPEGQDGGERLTVWSDLKKNFPLTSVWGS